MYGIATHAQYCRQLHLENSDTDGPLSPMVRNNSLSSIIHTQTLALSRSMILYYRNSSYSNVQTAASIMLSLHRYNIQCPSNDHALYYTMVRFDIEPTLSNGKCLDFLRKFFFIMSVISLILALFFFRLSLHSHWSKCRC